MTPPRTPRGQRAGSKRTVQALAGSQLTIEDNDADAARRLLVEDLQASRGEVKARDSELLRMRMLLAESNERLEIALRSNRIGTWDLDLNDHTAHRSPIHNQIFGYQTMLPSWTFDLFLEHVVPEDHARVERLFRTAIAEQTDWTFECRIRRADGVIRDIWATGGHTRDSSGVPVRVQGLVQDVTERVRAGEQVRLALEAAPTGMLIMSSTGAVVLVNTQIEVLFGYAREELLGKNIDMLVPERFRTNDPAHRNAFFAKPARREVGAGLELFGLRKNGSEIPIEIGLTPFHTSEGDFVISSVVDVSQRRENDRIRNEFISTVSHELRTPLTSISGSLGLLQSGAVGVLPEKAAAMVRIAYQNSDRLRRIINDILDIGRIEAGRLDLQMVNAPIGELVRQALEANSGYAEKYKVRFLLEQSDTNDEAVVDVDRLMQVMTNLLSNAAKFSEPDAAVVVRILSGPTAVRVEVEDSGSGIPEAFRARIFEKFAQADSSATRRFEGTGLGLSIARKLVEAMGGTIGFSTMMGRGTIFHIELPRRSAALEGTLTRPLPTVPTNKVIVAMSVADPDMTMSAVPRILHVEDDADLTTVLRMTLVGRADVVHAGSLRDAEARLSEGGFDLVVLDQELPDGSGLGLLGRIPALLGRRVPVVVLSAGDISPKVRRQVDAALVKSLHSSTQIANTILSCLS
jgi:PAS domain S-box-containing protein